jgi:tetratricopeptide (TPR) repeat protein
MTLTALVAALAAAAWSTRRPPDPTAIAARPWIVVAPIALSGTTDTNNLAGALDVALSSALSRYPSVDLVAPVRIAQTLARMQRPDSATRDGRAMLEVAERIGATLVAFPEAATLGRTTVLRLRVLAPDGAPAMPSVDARISASDEWIGAVDTVVAAFVQQLQRTESPRPVPLPAVRTASLPALRAYAAAVAARRNRTWDDAVLAMQQAVSLDSTFAQAWADLGVLYSQLNRPRDADTAFARALAVASALTPRERLLVRLAVLQQQRQPDSALREVNGWLLAFPRDRQLQERQASLRRDRGDHAGARRAYRGLLAVDSLDPDLWVNYAVAFPADQPDSAAWAYGRAARLDGGILTDAVFNNQWGAALVQAGRLDSAARIFSHMLDQPPALRARGLRSLAHLALWRQRPAEAVTLLREALPLEERAGTGATSVVRTGHLLAIALDAHGDTAAARRQRDAVLQRAVALGLQEPLLFSVLGKDRVRHGERRAARDMLARLQAVAIAANPVHTASRLALQAELDATDGQLPRALARADSAVALHGSSLTLDTRAKVLRQMADASGEPAIMEQAAAVDRTIASRREFGWEGALAVLAARARVNTPLHRSPTDRRSAP